MPVFIVPAILGCSSAYLNRESENSAYLEFRVGFPVPKQEACDAFTKLKDFCPSERYEIDLLGAGWGGQYYRVFKMKVFCGEIDNNEIETKDDSYFFNLIKEYIHPPACN